MTRQQIAEKAGCSRQHIDFILAGKRRPSKDLSERLEEVTGIKAEAWIFPDRHRNPYFVGDRQV